MKFGGDAVGNPIFSESVTPQSAGLGHAILGAVPLPIFLAFSVRLSMRIREPFRWLPPVGQAPSPSQSAACRCRGFQMIGLFERAEEERERL